MDMHLLLGTALTIYRERLRFYGHADPALSVREGANLIYEAQKRSKLTGAAADYADGRKPIEERNGDARGTKQIQD
jgi:hypothetical protein